jgi:hypothetical protein
MTLTANQIYLLGKMYMSYGDGQFDQGNHIGLEEERFRPLWSTQDKIFESFRGREDAEAELQLGDVLMGAVEAFLIDNQVEIEAHWLSNYKQWLEENTASKKAKTVYRMEVVVWQVDIEENGDETNTECMIEETIYQAEAPDEGRMVEVAEQIRDAFDKHDLLSSYLYDAFNTVLDEVMAQFA